MRLDVKSEAELQQRAKAGDIQAIAYWLNLYLLPQQQCARVSQLSPGYLDIQIRCRYAPSGDLLLHVLHARLARLALPQLRGAKVQIALARPYPQVLEDRFLIFQSPSLQVPSPQSPTSHLPNRFSLLARRQVQRMQAALEQRPWQRLSQMVLKHLPVTVSQVKATLQPVRLPQLKRPSILAGAAIATFLAGCGYEALTYYTTSPLRLSSRLLPSIPLPGLSRGDRSFPTIVDTVQLNQRAIPVYSVPSTTPGKGITLLFSPADTPAVSTSGSLQSDLTLLTVDAPHAELSTLPSTATIAYLSEHLSQRVGQGTTVRLRNTLEWQGLYTAIPSRHSEPSQPLLLETKGQRIVYLSYSPAAEDTALDGMKARLRSDLQALRPQVDWIIVNYDIASPLAAYPSDWQTEIARFAVDQGADVVVGYNPAVVQGAEYYKQGAIAYSVGRLDIPQPGDDAALSSLPIAFQVRLRRDRPLHAELAPMSTIPLPRSITLYLQQASGLFERPIPAPLSSLSAGEPSRSMVEGGQWQRPSVGEPSDPSSTPSLSSDQFTASPPNETERQDSNSDPFVTYPPVRSPSP